MSDTGFRSAVLFLTLSVALGACGGEAAPPATTDAGTREDAQPAPVVCSADSFCDDGLFCNGAERCSPRNASADAQGCVAGEPPCEAACDEGSETCGGESCDADGDGRRAERCGGDDCDDGDPLRFPTNPEVCDAADLDEDCDPTTFGSRDADGDGYHSIACCNVDGDGTRACGDDCDDGEEGIHPTEAEMCNRIDDDCDGVVDEDACNVPVTVSSDGGHACAVSSTGNVWCWGENDYGELGDGTTTSRATAAPVSHLVDAVEVDVDDLGYSCARTRGGDVLCWGGDDTCYSDEPYDVLVGMNVVDIDLYYYELCALTADGRTLCVALETSCRTVPITRCGTGPEGAVEIAVGGGFCCWRRSGGEVQCAGENDLGELGDGTTTSRATPAPVTGISDAISIDAGSASACAVRAGGGVWCWGDNGWWQLGRGDGAPEASSTPEQVVGLSSGASLVSVRSQNACALVSGTLQCWGRDHGAVPHAASTSGATHGSAGTSRYCVVQGEGVYCGEAFAPLARVGGIP